MLEFLAWGRNKDAAFGSTMTQASREFLVQDDISPTTDAVFGYSKKATIDLLKILLPDSTQISQLVEYNHACTLWYHNSYSAYIFDSDLSAVKGLSIATMRISSLNCSPLQHKQATATTSMR